MKRVVVTGIGAVTPIGHGAAGLWNGLRSSVSAVDRITRFDPSLFRSRVAAEVREFHPEGSGDPSHLRRLDRFSQFSLAAATQAVEDARLVLEGRRADMGIYMGSALSGIAFAESQHTGYLEKGLKAVSPFLALSVFGGASSCNIAMALGLTGPNITNSNSCASGAIAIGEAFHLIRRGGASVMLAGGAEAPLSPLCYGAFALIKAMTTRNDEPRLACRPFDRHRDGFVMGEGAAVLVLEERDYARARGARIYCEVLGYGITNDAYHMTKPDPEGREAARAMAQALEDARIDREEVDYINAHGSSTPLGDAAEAAAIQSVFGPAASSIPVSSTKGAYGHPLGASGAIEAAVCALIFKHDYLPPTLNMEEADSGCELDFLPKTGRERQCRAILSNSFGFGGINAALVFSRFFSS